MLRAAILFFVMGLFSFLGGLYGVAGFTMPVGKLLLLTFSIFAVVSFIGAVTTERSRGQVK